MGDRDVLEEAQSISVTDDMLTVEITHQAENGDSIILSFDFNKLYKSTERMSVEFIDIFDHDSDSSEYI